MDIATIKERQQAAWASGDYSAVGAALKADMVEVARSFDASDDDTLVLRQEYLEAVIHKPATR
jgi:hypothetical protein